MHVCLSPWALKRECVCVCAVIDNVLKAASLHIFEQVSISVTHAAHCSAPLDILALESSFSTVLLHFCLCESNWSQSAVHYLHRAIIHIVTFAFSLVTPGSQGSCVTQAAWTTPRPLIYKVFQGKAPPRGLSKQAHTKKGSLTQSFMEPTLECFTLKFYTDRSYDYDNIFSFGQRLSVVVDCTSELGLMEFAETERVKCWNTRSILHVSDLTNSKDLLLTLDWISVNQDAGSFNH